MALVVFRRPARPQPARHPFACLAPASRSVGCRNRLSLAQGSPRWKALADSGGVLGPYGFRSIPRSCLSRERTLRTTTWPSSSTTKSIRSPEATWRCSRICFGRVICPLLVMVLVATGRPLTAGKDTVSPLPRQGNEVSEGARKRTRICAKRLFIWDLFGGNSGTEVGSPDVTQIRTKKERRSVSEHALQRASHGKRHLQSRVGASRFCRIEPTLNNQHQHCLES